MKKFYILISLCCLTTPTFAKTYRVYQNPNIKPTSYKQWMWENMQVNVAKTNYVNSFIKMQPGEETPKEKNQKDINNAIKDVMNGDSNL